MGLRDTVNYIVAGDERLTGIGVTMDQISGLSLDMRHRQQLRTMPTACACDGDTLSGKRASSSSHAIYRAHDQFNAVFLLRTDLIDADYNLYTQSAEKISLITIKTK